MPEARNTVSPAAGVQECRKGLSSSVTSLEFVMSFTPLPKLDCVERDQRSQEGERRRNEKDCDAKWKAMQLKDWLSIREGSVSSQFEREERGQLTAGVWLFRVIDRGRSEASIPMRPKASGSVSGLSLHGKNNRTSRVIEFGGQVLEGSMVGCTEREVREPSIDEPMASLWVR